MVSFQNKSLFVLCLIKWRFVLSYRSTLLSWYCPPCYLQNTIMSTLLPCFNYILYLYLSARKYKNAQMIQMYNMLSKQLAESFLLPVCLEELSTYHSDAVGGSMKPSFHNITSRYYGYFLRLIGFYGWTTPQRNILQWLLQQNMYTCQGTTNIMMVTGWTYYAVGAH